MRYLSSASAQAGWRRAARARCSGSRRPAARHRRARAAGRGCAGTALAASSRSTVMRTSSEPARARAETGDGGGDVGRVGVRHRLHGDRRAAAHDDAADRDRDRDAAGSDVVGHQVRSPCTGIFGIWSFVTLEFDLSSSARPRIRLASGLGGCGRDKPDHDKVYSNESNTRYPLRPRRALRAREIGRRGSPWSVRWPGPRARHR